MTVDNCPTYNQDMVSRREKVSKAVPYSGVAGFPRISYRLPIVVTTLAAVVILVVSTFLALIAVMNIFTQIDNASSGRPSTDPVFTYCICAPLGLVLIAGSIYFLLVVVRGIRDLSTPLHYTRGTVAPPRAMTSRKNNAWLVVDARYAGPDRAQAERLTDEERAASPDRSQILQPRFASDAATALPPVVRSSDYIPADRLSSVTAQEVSTISGLPLTFRVDPAVLAVLRPEDEVLIAHSRYLEHIYYISHLRAGEWESFPNKALI